VPTKKFDPNFCITGTAPLDRTYPVIMRITIAEAAKTAAKFSNKKSPVIRILEEKSLEVRFRS
jgi:hypothetical protein